MISIQQYNRDNNLRHGHGMAILKPEGSSQGLYSFFGSNGDTLIDEILKYDLVSKKWTKIDYSVSIGTFHPRDSFGYCSNGANLFWLFGGYSLIEDQGEDQSVLTNELWQFDANDNSMTPVFRNSNFA
jgi:hypothetical protein